jgi:Periplasmic copper-binding protein (NosD)
MTGRSFRALVVLLALSVFLVVGGGGALAHGDDGEKLVVDDDLACPSADYPTIQAAVNAADPGDTILVCPGVYNEQVTIPKPLRIIGIDFQNEDAPIVKPLAAAPNSTSLTTGAPIAAVIVATNAKYVEIEGLTLDGSMMLNGACTPVLVGMYYRNTSGKFEHNAVRRIEVAGAPGCQSGLGVFVQSGNGGKSYVTIAKNTLHEYQKNGITANEPGTHVDVYGNTLSGFGVSPIIAQNGIQLGGATGSVHHNSVINHVYGPCTPQSCNAVSTNVLVFDTSGASVYENVLGKSQVNVYLEADKSKVEKNLIFDTDVFDGIYVNGDYNRIHANTINTSDEAAIWLDGTKNQVSWNVINEATEGIHDSAGGNSIGYNAFYNVVQKRTPAPTSLTVTALAVPTDEVEETTLVGLPSLNVPTASPLNP